MGWQTRPGQRQATMQRTRALVSTDHLNNSYTHWPPNSRATPTLSLIEALPKKWPCALSSRWWWLSHDGFSRSMIDDCTTAELSKSGVELGRSWDEMGRSSSERWDSCSCGLVCPIVLVPLRLSVFSPSSSFFSWIVSFHLFGSYVLCKLPGDFYFLGFLISCPDPPRGPSTLPILHDI